jgi:hypothetical protein
MSKITTRSKIWYITLNGGTLWGHCSWESMMKSYVCNRKLEYVAYHKDPRPATSTPYYRVYCVFTNRVRVTAVTRLFHASTCVPVHGKLWKDPGYCSQMASFVRIFPWDEPAQVERLRDVCQKSGGASKPDKVMTFLKSCYENAGDYAFMISEIYKLHPPLRPDARFEYIVGLSGVKRMTQKALLHYHPDHQNKGGQRHQDICMEIAKLLNHFRSHDTPI